MYVLVKVTACYCSFSAIRDNLLNNPTLQGTGVLVRPSPIIILKEYVYVSVVCMIISCFVHNNFEIKVCFIKR
jgi:hypothetical protein